ncbi:MAG TPA: hypothetical protein VK171_07205, partial [Fimbriimonas sp.]|nr:hypothetical protein [Fimbriimonas sp.]
MYYFGYLTWEFLYVDELCKRRPELAERPLVITKDRLVLDACRTSIERGVRRGQSEKLARSLVEGLTLVPWANEDYEEANRAWLDNLVPYTDVIEPVQQHSAFVDLSAHPDPDSVLMSLIISAKQGQSANLRVGVGRRRWLAELATIHQFKGISIDQPDVYLRPLPVSALLPVSVESQKRLAFLGYTTIGAVQQVPLEILKPQFGPEASVIYEAARGGYNQPVLPLYPEEVIRAEMRFEGGVELTEQIEAGLKRIANELAVKLSNCDGQGTELSLILEFEDGRTHTVSRTFAKPIHTYLTALVALALVIKDQITEPVVSIRAIMPRIVKQAGVQGAMPLSKNVERAANELAMNRLAKAFGDGAVVRASTLQKPWHLRFVHV